MTDRDGRHWSDEYVGIPWLWGGRTRAGLDCYGLVQIVYADVLGVYLPPHDYGTPTAAGAIVVDEATRGRMWRPIDDPAELDVAIVDAVCRDPHRRRLARGPWHLVVRVDRDHVLHAAEPCGVVVQPTPPNLVGWYRASCR